MGVRKSYLFDPIKPFYDNNEYKYVELNNNVKMVFISNPNEVKNTAAISVSLNQNAQQIPGTIKFKLQVYLIY